MFLLVDNFFMIRKIHADDVDFFKRRESKKDSYLATFSIKKTAIFTCDLTQKHETPCGRREFACAETRKDVLYGHNYSFILYFSLWPLK